MTVATSLVELRSALGVALDEAAALGGRAAADHFQRAVESAMPHGAPIAVQHLRNRLLAYVDGKGFRHQPEVGFKPRMRGEIKAAVDGLDQALLGHFRPIHSVARKSERGKRVLLLVDHLPVRDRMFSHTRQICTYAATLALDPNIEAICILATQETAPENPFRAAGEVGSAHEAGWRAEVEEVAGGPVPKIQFFTPERLGPVRPYEESIGRVRKFDPDIVFSHEGIFRSRLLPSLLHPQAAIVAVQMNQINPEPPYADLVLAHGRSEDFSHQPTPSRWRAHCVPLIPFPKERSIDPVELGPPSPLRVVTVLTLGRLEKGLMKDDAAGLKFVISFLEDHVDAVWLLVAIEDPKAFSEVIAPYVPSAVAERLRLMPVVPDLRAIFEHCHIYMHLPSLGGGNMGIAMAIDEGVPVLAREGTDGANTLHPEQTYAHEKQAARILRRLAREPELRARRLSRQQTKIKRDHSIQSLSVAFGSFLPEALASFEARRTAPPPRPPAPEPRQRDRQPMLAG
ncbi:MAG: hypothetical protein ACR2FH_02130 [Caulobacteraceae bacterium]